MRCVIKGMRCVIKGMRCIIKGMRCVIKGLLCDFSWLLFFCVVPNYNVCLLMLCLTLFSVAAYSLGEHSS